MTKAELIISTRNVLNVQSTDTGATLTDAVLGDFLDDAAEEVVIDLLPSMPLQFCITENITLVSGTQKYTLTGEFIQVYKVEKSVTASAPSEIEIIDPLEVQNYMKVGDTSAAPVICYFLGKDIYFVPTPSAAVTNYCKVYLVTPEAATIATNGPVYIPRLAHRLIVYKAAANASIMYDVNPAPYIALYKKRITSLASTWLGRFHQRARFIRKPVGDKQAKSYDWF